MLVARDNLDLVFDWFLQIEDKTAMKISVCILNYHQLYFIYALNAEILIHSLVRICRNNIIKFNEFCKSFEGLRECHKSSSTR